MTGVTQDRYRHINSAPAAPGPELGWVRGLAGEEVLLPETGPSASSWEDVQGERIY